MLRSEMRSCKKFIANANLDIYLRSVGNAFLVDVNLCVEGWTVDGYLICSIHDIQGSNKVNVN